mmetsp:Transcript_6818/g.17703  ORF Transcript_6818/g.17703 Transcript_6818/m.17703 type:complete len:157 (+) Transcript_6818:82-552(+)
MQFSIQGFTHARARQPKIVWETGFERLHVHFPGSEQPVTVVKPEALPTTAAQKPLPPPVLVAASYSAFNEDAVDPDRLRFLPHSMRCPITGDPMRDPVVASDGHSYERVAIMRWLETAHATSPLTNLPLDHREVTTNHALREAIRELVGAPKCTDA